MNVWLMYCGRDFDPHQELPANAPDLIQDLELDILFQAMAQEDKLVFQVARQAVLAGLDDIDAIHYRQEILRDCLRYPEIIRRIYRISQQAIEAKHGHWLGIFSRYPRGILSSAVYMLEMFLEPLRALKQVADQHAGQVESRGLQRFFTMIQQELKDEYFASIEARLRELKFRRGVLLSAQLGKGNEGAGYVPRSPKQGNPNWLKRALSKKPPAYSFSLHPRDDHGARALGDIRDRGINLIANAVAQSADHIDSFFNLLRQELGFYIGCLNLSGQLAQLGEPWVLPSPQQTGKRRLSCTGLYDVTLALTMQQKVVGNDVHAEGKDLVLITGANQGGKSTFLRSIGLAQLMMQGGLFVAAQTFSAELYTGLFTHYKREEDATMVSGKFDEELHRMSAIIDVIKPNALILFNESFAATSEREGSEIARQIVDALMDRQIRVIYVTHLYELAQGFYERALDDALFLRADRRRDGTRTFKLKEGEPLQTSYGVDLYKLIFDPSG